MEWDGMEWELEFLRNEGVLICGPVDGPEGLWIMKEGYGDR